MNSIDLSEYETGAGHEGEYGKTLKRLQKKLAVQQSLHIVHKRKTLIVFEGWDAAGKGGAIKRMTARWDPRYFEAYSIAAPTAEEKDKHFLWRFWSKLPGSREISVLDRSHYGRVLVERVENFATETEWRRGYDEINEFEAQQCDIGTKVIKIFLHVTKNTQERVLQERLDTPSKRWKVTEEDFRNLAKRDEYFTAINEMFEHTNTRWAPWKVFDGNNQKAARIAVLEHVIAELEASIPQDFPEADPAVVKKAKNALK